MIFNKRVFTSMLSLAATSLAQPTFTKIFDGALLINDSIGFVPGPFGPRALYAFTGGNLTDPNSGDVVANIIPGVSGQWGVLGSNEIFYPDVRVVAQWVDDQTYAFWDVHGSGIAGASAANYARFETNSASRLALNNKFLLLTIEVADESAIFEIYSLDD
ncbi:hypothetical protein BDZ89DRAFT_822544 [Hymenopellis radicata]|nr:hypothetical protein BDZ89DRAFT_822544 [Hymenopellis radicata]